MTSLGCVVAHHWNHSGAGTELTQDRGCWPGERTGQTGRAGLTTAVLTDTNTAD